MKRLIFRYYLRRATRCRGGDTSAPLRIRALNGKGVDCGSEVRRESRSRKVRESSGMSDSEGNSLRENPLSIMMVQVPVP